MLKFIHLWNISAQQIDWRTKCGRNDDVLLADSLISELISYSKTTNRRPLFNQYFAKFTCNVCGSENLSSTWKGKKYRSIPILTFPNDNLRGISAGELLTQELVQKVEAKCQNCPYWSDNARISVKTGEHTAFVVTRRGYLNPDGTYKSMLRTKITDMRKQCAGEKFLRDLICVISHQGPETGGNFVCYSKVDDTGVWYRNSDITQCEQSPHPFHSRKRDEDNEMLIYRNY